MSIVLSAQTALRIDWKAALPRPFAAIPLLQGAVKYYALKAPDASLA
jgi:hypothetical protein